MDPRILLVVVALPVVYWLVRSRLMLHSQSGGEAETSNHPHRRFSDRTPSGRWLQRSVERDELESESDPLQNAANRVLSNTGTPAPAVFEPTVRFPRATVRLPLEQKGISGQTSDVDSHGKQPEVDEFPELMQQRDRILVRNRHAMEEVAKLKKKLFDKGREMEMLQQACARSDAALVHYRTRAQGAAMLEQQLAEAREQADRRGQELSELRSVMEQQSAAPQLASTTHEFKEIAPSVPEVTRRKNQISKKQLARELSRVEKQAEHARQNSLELRRIRSELELVCADRANAKNRIAELQVRVQAQQRTLESARSSTTPSVEINVLRQTLEERQHQNEVLMQQLARLSDASPGASSLTQDDDAGSQDESNNDEHR